MTRNHSVKFCLLITLCAIVFAQAQPQSDDVKIDGVAAVVGNEIVLESDLERDFQLAQQEGYELNNKCDFFSNTLIEKLVLYEAKRDTLIEVTNDRVKRSVEDRLAQLRARAGSDEVILDYYGLNTITELKSEMEFLVRDQIFAMEKQNKITKDVDATPAEVKEFFEKHQDELPDIPEEVEIAHIVMYPEITEEHRQEIIDQLKQIKKEVEEGANFSTKAILYSEDPGSSTNGGLYTDIRRGKFVPEFDAVSFNLEEGEISEPFETEFGFHIAKLEKRKGQSLDIRHILIQPKPTADELETAKLKLDSIRQRIEDGYLTFKEAAFLNSKDKYTKFNGGLMTNPQKGDNRFVRNQLPVNTVSSIAGLSEGEMSEVFKDKEPDGKEIVRLVRLERVIPAHQVNFETDFALLKNYTVQNKEQEELIRWAKTLLPYTFIKIDEDYQNCQFELDWLKDKE